jgi:hypothetical protein
VSRLPGIVCFLQHRIIPAMADASTNSPAPASLTTALTGEPPKKCRAEAMDFKAVKLPSYDGAFAVLIHDLFSAEECAALLAAAEEASDNKWAGAMVNIGFGRQQMMTDVRLCDRILWDEKALAEKLCARILPHLPANIITLHDSPQITGNGPAKRKETYQITRLNERLRFLKYTPGMYFKEHCDGSYVTPDGQEISLLTVHVYLNGSETKEGELPLTGGATRFFSPMGFYGRAEADYADVNPRTGTCLVFQHRNLLHSGEEVITGTKYTMRTDIMYKRIA